MSRLPVPEGPIDELLDLRDELEPVVARFRRGLLTASAQIQLAQWDDAFENEADRVYTKEVAPALEELEDLLRSRPAFRSFFSEMGKAIEALGAGAVVGVVLAQIFQVAPTLATLYGIGAAATPTIMNQIEERREHQHQARQNDWFFLYKAREKLETP